MILQVVITPVTGWINWHPQHVLTCPNPTSSDRCSVAEGTSRKTFMRRLATSYNEKEGHFGRVEKTS